MKTKIVLMLIALIISSMSSLKSQQQPEQLNLPGDNLNLYAVMKIFQESETLEIFEKKLNDQNTRINNLDLNGDNYIDYLKVVDYVEKNVHYVVIQDAISATENQDVAVFVVKKDPDGKVIIQLIGDEALYGKYYIVEPYYDNDKGSTPNPGYYGNNNYTPTQTIVVHQTTAYEVAAWPLITYIFLPTYVVYHSGWHYGYYPTYWQPWTPWYWHEYYGYHYYWHDDYYGHYHHNNHYRYEKWHDNYYGHHRTFSNTVRERRERGEYKGTYTKPESISEGSARFRKDHPDKVRTDVREPNLRDIRVDDRSDKKAGGRANEKPASERVNPPKPDNRTGNAHQANPQQNQPANTRPNYAAPKKDNSNPGKTENHNGNSRLNNQGTNTPPATTNPPGTRTKPEQKQNNSKQELKPGERHSVPGNNRQNKQEPKRDNTKTKKESDKPDRK